MSTTRETETSRPGRTTRGGRAVAVAAGLAVLALVGGGAAVAATRTAEPTGSAAGSATTVTAGTDEALTTLAFNRDEERMARDLYTLFADTYGTGPFERIADSEQQHFDAVGSLLDSYGIDDPAVGLEAGEYADPAVQQLYDDWKAQGLESLDAALQVGVELEERDIADLEDTLDRVDQADVQAVLSRLLAASQMHLRAFTAWVDGDTTGLGGNGRGSGQGMGQGMGQGTGRGMGQGMGRGSAGGDGTGDCPMSSSSA
ncbi:DUF2202 domain-containing protein [Nocardioides sp.]|uniref:DUF2202 domain-containing protein n=1 Tax=Nocardioides sp. TaxID=35761 RepID=UPI00352782B3